MRSRAHAQVVQVAALGPRYWPQVLSRTPTQPHPVHAQLPLSTPPLEQQPHSGPAGPPEHMSTDSPGFVGVGVPCRGEGVGDGGRGGGAAYRHQDPLVAGVPPPGGACS